MTTLCAILETGGALGGVDGCGPCAWADAEANNWRDRKDVAAPNTLDLMVRPPAARDNEREAVSWRSTDALKQPLTHFVSCTSRLAFPAPLVASCNFSRQYAELIDVPIADQHLDSRYHRLIAGPSLGLASSQLRPQMFEFAHSS